MNPSTSSNNPNQKSSINMDSQSNPSPSTNNNQSSNPSTDNNHQQQQPQQHNNNPSSSKNQTQHLSLQNSPTSPNTEPMRRIRMLLREGLIGVGQCVQFTFHEDIFQAMVCIDGSLKGPIDYGNYPQMFFASPTEFVQTMAELAVSKDPTKRQRGKIMLNGWEVCYYYGESLAALRNHMLRARRDIPQLKNPLPMVTQHSFQTSDDNDIKSNEQKDSDTRIEKDNVPKQSSEKDNSKESRDINKEESQLSPSKPDESKQQLSCPVDEDKIVQEEDGKSKSPPPEAKNIDYEIKVEDNNEDNNKDSTNNLKSQDNDTKQVYASKQVDNKSGNPFSNNESQSDKVTSPQAKAMDSNPQSSQMPTISGQQSNTASPSQSKDLVGYGEQSDDVKDSTEQETNPLLAEAQNESQPISESVKDSNDCRKDTPTENTPEKMEIDDDSVLQQVGHENKNERPDKSNLLDNNNQKNCQIVEKPKEDNKESNVHKDEKVLTKERAPTDKNENMSDVNDVNKEQQTPDKIQMNTPEASKSEPIMKIDGSQRNTTIDDENKNEVNKDQDSNKGQSSRKRQYPSSKSSSPEKPISTSVPEPVRKKLKVSNVEAEEKEKQQPSPKVSEKELDEEENEIQPAVMDKTIKKSSPSQSRSPPKRTDTGKTSGLKRKPKPETGSARASRASTPSRKEPERTVKTKTEAGKSKKNNGSAGADANTVELDAEAIEAAAIAERAEKEEANNRGRRTTRLAAGKIKQVDYKASANPLVPKGYSEQDSDEIEAEEISNEQRTDNGRNLRRRVNQTQQIQPQRTSKRNKSRKHNSSNGKSSSSGARTSSAGNGTNGSSRDSKKDSGRGSGRGESMDLETSAKHKLSGQKQEGRERKRTRGENGKRTRHHYNHDDYDPYARTYGTRSSTRENSAVDVEEGTDIADLSDNPEDEEDELLEIDESERTNYAGWNISELTCIAGAIKKANSLETSEILDALNNDEEWDEEDAKKKRIGPYIAKIISSIESTLEMVEANTTSADANMVLAYLATEAWRLRTGGINTGLPHTSTKIQKQIEKLEHEKSTLERGRKKINREVDELRSKLESEMESRRKTELDAAYLEYQIHDLQECIKREQTKIRLAEEEIEKYRKMESESKTGVEEMRVFVAKLKGEKDTVIISSDGNKASEEGKKEIRNENGSMDKNDNTVRGSSMISDDDVEMIDEGSEGSAKKRLQMGRLRALIAAREAEAETFQRICEQKRMEFVTIMEVKNRLDDELYHLKAQPNHGYISIGAASGPTSNAIKTSKEDKRKTEHRGTSGQSSKTNGNQRGKSSGTKTSGQASGSGHKSGNGSKQRHTQGKNGDQNRNGKRKGVGKSQASKSEK